MLTGFNTDIDFEGVTYHVQTEDRGGTNPLIESLVYVKGEILATRRTEYSDLLEAGAEMPAIQILMERQHRNIVDAIRTGRIDVLTEPPVGGASDTTVSRRSRGHGQARSRPHRSAMGSRRGHSTRSSPTGSRSSSARRGSGCVSLGGDDLVFGAPFALQVSSRRPPGRPRWRGAHVAVRFLSTAMKPTKLAEGSSDEAGAVELKGTIPETREGPGTAGGLRPARPRQRRGQVPGPALAPTEAVDEARGKRPRGGETQDGATPRACRPQLTPASRFPCGREGTPRGPTRAIVGFSRRRRTEYGYQWEPNGTYTRRRWPAPVMMRRSSGSTPSSIWNS